MATSSLADLLDGWESDSDDEDMDDFFASLRPKYTFSVSEQEIIDRYENSKLTKSQRSLVEKILYSAGVVYAGSLPSIRLRIYELTQRKDVWGIFRKKPKTSDGCDD